MSIRARRDRSTTLIRLCVGLLLLVGIVLLVDPDEIVAAVSGANGLWIVAAVALLPVNLYLESAKWQVLLAGSGVRIGRMESLGSILSGYSLGSITPARIGDYVGRILYLLDSRKGTLLVMAGLDRVYSVWIYTLAGTAALSFQVGGSLPGPGGVWGVTFALGLLLSLVLGLVAVRPGLVYEMGGPLLPHRQRERWHRHFEATRGLGIGTKLCVALLSATRYLVFCTQFVLLLLAFTPATPVATLYLGAVLVFFVKTVIPSISLFDLGIRESAAVFFLGILGVQAGAALSASLMLFAVNLLIPALVGIGFVPRIRLPKFGRSVQQAHVAEVRSA